MDNNTKRNYQKELEKILEREAGKKPSLFLHSCCAPCSSYVLTYLLAYFRITVFFYNPNITDPGEYEKRLGEQIHFLEILNWEMQKTTQASGWTGASGVPGLAQGLEPVKIFQGRFEPERFFQAAKGMEHIPEGGERCTACYSLRLRETVKEAELGGYDYVATTLTISPLKNAEKLNQIGERLCLEKNVSWLPSDFKKKGGYQRSIELSRQYGLYRQDYCGCVYSKQERRNR